MKRTTAFLAAFAFCTVSAYADYSVSDKGTWPRSWPEELEPLRKQARSLRGSIADVTLHEIPFAKREEFEAAWPHILKVKTKGAPVMLVRAPDTWMGKIDAGVRIHCPPGKTGEPVAGGAPIPGSTNVRERWLYTNYIELIVDGKIVDLNRIPLPPDMLIIDRRFNDGLTAWGMEVGGLQAGLGYHQGRDRAYGHGETVGLVVRVRNVGKEAVRFRYVWAFLVENPPVVTDAEGKRIPLDRIAAMGEHAPKTVDLAPGKAVDLYELTLRPSPTGEVSPSQKAEASVGRLRASGKVRVQYERLTSTDIDDILSKLATGKLELEINPESAAATDKE